MVKLQKTLAYIKTPYYLCTNKTTKQQTINSLNHLHYGN